MNDPSRIDPGVVQISPEAAVYLERLLEDWRTDILAHALQEQIAHGVTDAAITVSDIESAATKLEYALWHGRVDQPHRQSRRAEWVLGVGSVILMAAGIAIVAFTALRDRFDVTVPFTASAAFGVLGALLSVVGIYAERRARKRAEMDYIVEVRLSQTELMRSWAQLERAMRATAAGDARDAESMPLRRVIEAYADANQLSEEDVRDIRAGLRARNRIAHEGRLNLSAEELANLEQRLVQQLMKARRRLHTVTSNRTSDKLKS
ncbi:hypothetical protein ABZ671_19345 [Micromonospora sp. NPDC006766]|uniref:hypothetical protein n=1 Tax=Micromonospora sp. NPDC006766 TaxID=3154778 RepID=UPI0033EAE210